jgi:hypothetical protein
MSGYATSMIYSLILLLGEADGLIWKMSKIIYYEEGGANGRLMRSLVIVISNYFIHG